MTKRAVSSGAVEQSHIEATLAGTSGLAAGDLDVVIGVDVGGTHTDVLVSAGTRRARGKALTTYDDFSVGVLSAIQVAGCALELELADLLGGTRLVVNGTTVVTNAITELRGSRVGVLVTAGFRDTFRFAGGPRLQTVDDHLQVNMPDIVDRDALVEVTGRIDYAGNELIPLRRPEIERAVDHLVEDLGVNAVAVCFLSSYMNPEHELQVEQIVAARHPEVFVSLSHRVFPLRGENRRWTTAVLNSFVYENAQRYLHTLDQRLAAAGLRGKLAFFQGIGGGLSKQRAEQMPLALLQSGPAGGAIGANELARQMGYSNLLLGDMGGTSFDTGVIKDNVVRTEKNVSIGRMQTGVNILDVVSVGAGGGSIAWVSERGIPQVGPASTGSSPGPACYGTGGQEPTVTDAMLMLGFLDPDNYLGGRVKLRQDLSAAALSRVFGERFGWSAVESAAAVHDLVVVNMATAIREVSVQRGLDPRQFVFFAYGGSLPMFAWSIAERLDIPQVLIPDNSSVFCAQGLISSDYVLRRERTVLWDLDDPTRLDDVNGVVEELATLAAKEMSEEGFGDEAVELTYRADLRFTGQVHDLSMDLPSRLIEESDRDAIKSRFRAVYEDAYGAGTAWSTSSVQMVNVTVTAIGKLERPPIPRVAPDPRPPESFTKGERSAYLPSLRAHKTVTVFDAAGFTAGSSVEGPGIIDASDTTIYVPPNVICTRDEWMNFSLRAKGES